MSENEKNKEKKPGFFARLGPGISKWFREMRSELKKVVWPTMKQLRNNTIIVIVSVIIVGLIVAAFDWVSVKLIILVIDTLRA